ncbi:hypothetical protein [Streptomyces sp. NPDC010273]|uniref:hypothetical protein n=1 Tax=Streptomyces sp. NPDC010273 TaxID=3364829 RepID=UPI0036EE0A5F
MAAIDVLLKAGAADGSLKPGLDPEDVLLQLSVLWRLDPARGGEARAGRILGLIVDGLRAGSQRGCRGCVGESPGRAAMRLAMRLMVRHAVREGPGRARPRCCFPVPGGESAR